MATTPTIPTPTVLPTATSAGSSTPLDAYSALSSQDFMKIMLSELSNQDPLKPNDTSTLLQEMSTLRSIQSDLDLQTQLQSMVSQNQLSTAGGLIGKRVSGLTAQFDRAEGVVKSVVKTTDGPVLVLTDGTQLPFNNVDQFLDPTTPDTGNTGTTTP